MNDREPEGSVEGTPVVGGSDFVITDQQYQRCEQMTQILTVREWDADVFHRRVLEMTAQGYTVIRESYQITPEMHPATGEIIHLHQIDLEKLQGHPDKPVAAGVPGGHTSQ